MAWGVVGTSTLGGTADIVEFTGATGTVFNTILTHTIGSGAVWNDLKLNSDGGSLYAQRRSKNGAADTLITSQAKLTQESYGTSGEDVFSVGYLTAISGEEKLYYGFGISGSTKGAGTAPIRNEHAAKYVPSVLTDTMTDFARVQGSSGDYLIDSNISVLGSDLTPSAAVPFAENAQVGSRAEITDTRKMYHFVAGNTPTYETDFTTNTGWVEADSGKIGVDTSTERLDFNILRDGSNDKAYYDLGSALSDTAWVMRFKCTMTAQNYTSSSNKIGSFGMSSVTGSATTTQDFLGLYKASNGDNASVVVDGSILGPSTGSSLGRPAAGTIRYHEMKRTSATSWTNSIYSTSDYSGTPDATHTLTIASSIIGLRYFNITNWIGTGGVGNVAGYIDDVTIYDGVTSVQVGNAWSEEGT